jgi:hypothetical protein
MSPGPRPMAPIGASVASTLVAACLSAAIVLGFELAVLDPGYRATQPPPPWAAAGAMAIFALGSGAISAMVAALLGRWIPVGLGVYALGVLVFAAWLSRLALATRPTEAPMYLALHVVFAIAFGIAIPLAWYVA